jgi:pimeloyl-ACP methyl ester carboxylesterase
VVGSSYGGYLGALLTSLRAVRWLGMRAPAIYKGAGWELPKHQLNRDPDLAAYRRRAVRPEDNRALCACAGFRGDVLVVESEHDPVVPHPVIENYLAACAHARSLTYRVIEGADHSLTEDRWRRAYSSLLVTWLKEMTGDVRRSPAALTKPRLGVRDPGGPAAAERRGPGPGADGDVPGPGAGSPGRPGN